MAKKSKALPEKVSEAEALRLRVALLELEKIKAEASRAVEQAAAYASKAHDDIWSTYQLREEDSVNLVTFEIVRAG